MADRNLAKQIHELWLTDKPSQVILRGDQARGGPQAPAGVLLLKPSSGHFPLQTIRDILERLTVWHAYHMRSAVWWNGRDIQANGLMSLHYPGFYRMAHGGLEALGPAARSKLRACYAPAAAPTAFDRAFGRRFEFGLVRTPYQLCLEGFSPEQLNGLWELDRSQEPELLRRIQRLDDDTLCLAMQFPDDQSIPPGWRGGAAILVNGFFAKLEKDFESHGCIALWIEQGPNSATSWNDLRQKYAGSTNPAKAPPATIRGDAARGILPVETVSILANVIHLSATEAEGRREVEEVWWEPARLARVFGH